MGGGVNQAWRASAGSLEPAGDANEDRWCVSVEVEEQEVFDEVKNTYCYGGTEKKKTLTKHHAQLLERINVLRPASMGAPSWQF
jgi:hypothetical protein